MIIVRQCTIRSNVKAKVGKLHQLLVLLQNKVISYITAGRHSTCVEMGFSIQVLVQVLPGMKHVTGTSLDLTFSFFYPSKGESHLTLATPWTVGQLS